MSHHLPDTSELVATLNRYGVELDEEFHPALVRYCTLLWKWNARLNLTRHTDYDAFVARDLIDTLRLSQQTQHTGMRTPAAPCRTRKYVHRCDPL